MWREVDAREWGSRIASVSLPLPLFFQPVHIEPVADVCGVRLRHFLFVEKERVLGASAIYEEGDDAVTPESYSFSPYWVTQELGERVYFDIHASHLESLKRRYRKIAFRLDTATADIRPFLWAGFTAEPKYTHLKCIDPEATRIPYHHSLRKDLGKQSVAQLRFEVAIPSDEGLELNMRFLSELGTDAEGCAIWRALLKRWSAAGHLLSFNVRKAERLLCAGLTLVDKPGKRIYGILVNKVSDEKYVHAFLYHSMIQWCAANDVSTLDFCGGSIPSISVFKSQFRTELRPYFKVAYEAENRRYGKLNPEYWHRSVVPLLDALKQVEHPEHRIFLEAVLHARTSREIYERVAMAFPGCDPMEKVFEWIAALCGPERALGFQLNASTLKVARLYAEGTATEVIAAKLSEMRATPLSKADIESVVADLRSTCLAMLFS